MGGSTVDLNGSWSNLGGTITADATSALNFGGSFATANLGTLSLTPGSQVNVTGAWDNSGQIYNLNNATGSWTLNGGTISGGTLNITGGETLLITANVNNLLTGVTVNGDLTLNTMNADEYRRGDDVYDRAHDGQFLRPEFAPGQTLTGTILFEGTGGGTRYVTTSGVGSTFTIGPTGVIRTQTGFTGNGQIGTNPSLGQTISQLTNQGLISSQTSGRTITINPVSLTNSGTGILEATGGGRLTIGATNWSSAGNLRALGGSTVDLNGSWSNLGGTITADATSALNFGGSFATANLGTLSLTPGSQVNVTGAWDNSGQIYNLNNATGSWTLNGGTISGGTLNITGGETLLITANVNNLLTGVTVNGDLTLNTMNARTSIDGGTTFTTAPHDGQFLRPEFRAGSDAHRNDPLRRDRRRHAVRHDEWRREYVHHRPHGRDPHSDRLHRQRADRHEPEPRTDHIPAH